MHIWNAPAPACEKPPSCDGFPVILCIMYTMYSQISLRTSKVGFRTPILGFRLLDYWSVGLATIPVTILPAGWGCLRVALKSYQISSPSAGHQASEREFPRPPKDIKNRPWNNENSSFCEKLFLLNISHQMLVSVSPRHPIANPNTNRKQTWDKHGKRHRS